MNRIAIIVLFSSLFVLYLYKYSYPKVIEGATGDADEAEAESEDDDDDDDADDEKLTKRQRKKRKKMKRKTTKRINKEFKKNKEAVKKSSDLTKKEKKAEIDNLKSERDFLKQKAVDNMTRESNEFYNNYDGMVLASAKNYLQKIHGQIIVLGQSIYIQLDLSEENIRIEDRVSKEISNFIGLLKARITFLSKLRIYLNEKDEDFKKTQSELLNEINNESFITNVSSIIEKLIIHYEQKGSALKVPTLESSSSDFNYHFNSIDNISSKLVILR